MNREELLKYHGEMNRLGRGTFTETRDQTAVLAFGLASPAKLALMDLVTTFKTLNAAMTAGQVESVVIELRDAAVSVALASSDSDHGTLREHLDSVGLDIMHRKNHDYARRGGGANPFDNFEMVEKLGITDTFTGFQTRMTDKLTRLANFIDGGEMQVKGESFTDSIIDLRNYLILLSAYVRSNAGGKVPAPEPVLSRMPVFASVPKGGEMTFKSIHFSA